ncbi:archaemetzincin [Chitinophaga qingshengii]|uniref:Zn-dependent protease n=1 Tax=Chitinophaga qingshengii TaxID=1569794 RepID=A0ABR7TM17_9BACT|nr:archaemetzincin [Chitinophaga qingshengii]MBC9930568.1 Zn-dependent protease [Chitinophaga qingshengii]
MPVPKIPLYLGLVFLLTACGHRSTQQTQYFEAVAANDIPLATPRKGEWRFEHPEKVQTFEAYQQMHPVKPSPARSVIYLLPIGDFPPAQEKILKATAEYTAIFFQLKTVLLPAQTDSAFPGNTFRQREDGHIQLLAPYILDTLLKGKIPADGIVLMGISARDLYPKKEWNYVFGLASYVDRIGVSSIYRLQDTTHGQQCLKRLIKVTSHEIGHMFSLHHCLHARCAMNGSNSLQETDQAPNRLCSDCQQKLYWNLQYDNQKRLQQLIQFCQQHELQRDENLLGKDMSEIK